MTTKVKAIPAPTRDATANCSLRALSPADFGRIAIELEPVVFRFTRFCTSRREDRVRLLPDDGLYLDGQRDG